MMRPDGGYRATTQVHKGKHKYHREDDKVLTREELARLEEE
jgi:hypothetical protein